MVTVENEYYLRTILLLCEGGSHIAKLIIKRELPKYGGDLDALLKQFRNKLKHEFHEKQMEKLFPNNGYDKTDLSKWDIQMLIGAMLLLFRKTLTNEEKQKLREIKLIRHEVLAHSPTASLYLEKYEDVQKQLGDAIISLAKAFDQTVEDKCNEYIKTYAYDPLEVKSAIKRLQEAKDTDDLFHEVINVIRKTQEELSKEIRTAESNIRQDLKNSEQNILKGLGSVEKNINLEVGYTAKTLSKEINEIKSNECNTFKALVDMSGQIKYLQTWLMLNMKRHSNDRTAADWQNISDDLRLKSVEIGKKMLNYDRDSSQPSAGATVTKETSFSHSQNQDVHGGKLLVAAIDFGTTYSGYAYSFKHDFETDPLKISAYVYSARPGLLSSKAPTSVLFDPEKHFHSFGYDAEEKYNELAEEDEHHDWYFYRRFKMKLYTDKVHRDLELEENNGKTMKAVNIFGAAIKYFKDHLMRLLKQRTSEELGVSDIHWILTVPAIWTDQAKQFMREAANTAGIPGSNLSIALEPEAASIYCQQLPVDISLQGSRLNTIRSGTKYMVIDLGGGTADITVHEKQSDGGLRELHKATGGAWGGTKVDKEFEKLIISIVGEEVFEKFSNDHGLDYLDMQRNFEVKKRVQNRYAGKVTIKIPVCLSEICSEIKGKSMEAAIKESIYDGKVTWIANDKLRIEFDIWNGLFETCCQSIVRHLSDLLGNVNVKGTNVFLMVGGFSNCAILQTAIKSAFPSVRFIIPNEPETAVLRGSVIFGHRPSAISSRVSKYTYGISISPLFDCTIHPEFRRVSINGTDRCRDVFRKYIYAGENIRIGDTISWEYTTLWPGQSEMKLKMYASTHPNPMYVDEEDTKYIGDVVVKLPESDKHVAVNVKMIFGGTELTVEATELLQGTKYTAYFDFL